jgi:hypothetical protein
LSRSAGAGSGGVRLANHRRPFVQPLAHGGQQVAADGQRAVVGVGAGHHDPRRLRGGGLAQEGFADLDEAVVELEVGPLGFGDAPARVGVLFQRLQPLPCCWALDRWNQYFSSSTPSSQSILSRRWISAVALEKSPASICAHHTLHDGQRVPGAEEDADLPLGRQRPPEAPVRGALGLFVRRRPKAVVWMWRGSIHSLSRLTVSPLPAPSTPAIRISTGKRPSSFRSYCALSSAARKEACSRW